MAYRIEIVRRARKQILSFPKEAQSEIALTIDLLKNNPRPSGCKKLRATALWRLRVRHYRVVYAVDDKAHLVTILKIAVRSEGTYQGL